jgi:hypothetical protein
VLLAVWGATLISAFAFGKFNADRTRHSIRPLLMLTSALLVVMAALFWLRHASHTPLAGFSLFIALGMAASFIGDLIMAEYIRTPERVLFGFLAFGGRSPVFSCSAWARGRWSCARRAFRPGSIMAHWVTPSCFRG